MRTSETLEDQHLAEALHKTIPGEPRPGLLLVFSAGRPTFAVIALEGGAIEIGRGEVAGVPLDDARLSRKNTRVTFDGNTFTAPALNSRNGTAADGQPISGGASARASTVVRAGGSLFLPVADTRPHEAGVARSNEAVMGPALSRALASILRLSRSGRVLHITGETGSGKELAARAFHDGGPHAGGPFVAVNAATLKPELAEGTLFGTRKGAYTNAVDRVGLVQAAHHGTLFLDEVADLDLAVQAKLLRVLETREVLPLGSGKPEPVDFHLCSATHASLPQMVADGKMRQDLVFRIATPTVRVPPLRERLEEIPWLIERAAKDIAAREGGAAIALHVSFVEACLLRAWPGNVRELLAEAKAAAQWAADDGGTLLARHLSPPAAADEQAADAGAAPRSAAAQSGPRPSDAEIDEAMRAAGNKVAVAARALGMHRTQLYRRLAQRGRDAAERSVEEDENS